VGTDSHTLVEVCAKHIPTLNNSQEKRSPPMGILASRRTHEIGIRMALGADPRAILRLILRSGVFLLLFGVSIGCVLALAVGWTMRSLLFGVHPADPLTFAAVGFLLGSSAILACYIPARRAMRVDPLVALRYE
jgi:putative ABC transport system permease protein